MVRAARRICSHTACTPCAPRRTCAWTCRYAPGGAYFWEHLPWWPRYLFWSAAASVCLGALSALWLGLRALGRMQAEAARAYDASAAATATRRRSSISADPEAPHL